MCYALQWKVFVLDEGSKKLVDSVVKTDDILRENVTSAYSAVKRGWIELRVIDIEQIEERRAMNQDLDVIYLLSPEPHIIECLIADLERQRYRRSYVVWNSSSSPSFQLP